MLRYYQYSNNRSRAAEEGVIVVKNWPRVDEQTSMRDAASMLYWLLEDEQIAGVGEEWEALLKAAVVRLLQLVDPCIMLLWPNYRVEPGRRMSIAPELCRASLSATLGLLVSARRSRPWRPSAPRQESPLLDALTAMTSRDCGLVCTMSSTGEIDPLPPFMNGVNTIRGALGLSGEVEYRLAEGSYR